MIFNRTKYSDCKNCPLRDNNRVWGRTECDSLPKYCIIGEAPGDSEDILKKPFVGPAGSWLNYALSQADIRRQSVHLTNVICCHPPRNDISSAEALEAIKCCSKGFEAEIDYLINTCGIKALTPTGNTSSKALGIDFGILKIRGSVYTYKDIPVVPTYHPSYIQRGNTKEVTTWICDIKKAYKFLYKPYKKPKEDFILFPTVKDVEDFYNEAKENKYILGVDIETTGLTPEHGEIVVTGFSINNEKALSLPRLKKGGGQYWDVKDRKKIKSLMKKLLELPTMFQNALFDIYFLESKGYPVKNFIWDTMALHHVIHPELPHTLDYITSVYGNTPYWKNTLKDRPGLILSIADESLRKYNLRDCIVMHQVLPGLLSDAKALRTLDVYETKSKPLIRTLIEIRKRGMPFSQSRCATWRKTLIADIDKNTNELMSMLKLPKYFSFSSGDHLRYLFYGVKASQFVKAENDLIEKYGKDSKLSKNTKVYRELVEKSQLCSSVEPLCVPRSFFAAVNKKSNSVKTDKEAFTNLSIACNKRISEILNKKRPGKGDEDEIEGLRKTITVINVLGNISKLAKLKSTYTSFPLGLDGRVHSLLTIGPSTGRLASKEPNLQNLPKYARRMFTAPEGYTFIEGDYTGLELWVLAYVSDDDVLIHMLENNMIIHDENTKLLYKITPDDPTWSKRRRTAKTYIFGRNYGGSLAGIYRRIMLENPDIDLTLSEFREIDNLYRKAHPKYFKWVEEIESTLKSTRMLRTVFGRIRIFLSDESSIMREGLNFPIQSTGADITNTALMKLDKKLTDTYGKDAEIVMTVHDSILILCKDEFVSDVVKLMDNVMTEKVKINKYNVSPKVDITIGKDWYDQSEVGK